MPQFSIVIPTYNRRDYLLQSLASVLEQQEADFEIVVSDNGSTDGTQAAVAPYLHDPRVRYFRNDSNLGMVGNWRKAIFERARFDWVVLMSDDDYFVDPTYLRDAARLIDEGAPKFVYAGGHVEDISTGTKQLMLPPFDGITDGRAVFASRGTVKPQDLILCNVVFNRRDAARLGFLSNGNNLSSDSELCLKLALEGTVGIIRRPVCVYRVHAGNLTKRIAGSASLLRGNLEYLIHPYSYGKTLGVPSDVLERYRSNALLDATARHTLLRTGLHSREAHAECRCFLKEQAPEILHAAESGWAYRVQRLVALYGSSLLGPRYRVGP